MKLGSTGSVVGEYGGAKISISLPPASLAAGSAGPVPHLLVAAAKSGTIYVVNRDNMAHFHAGRDSQIVQSLPGILPNGLQEEGKLQRPGIL